MYSSEFQESLKAVEAAREENIKYEPTRMTAKEKGLKILYRSDKILKQKDKGGNIH